MTAMPEVNNNNGSNGNSKKSPKTEPTVHEQGILFGVEIDVNPCKQFAAVKPSK